MSYDPMAGFFSAYNTMATNRRADAEERQRQIEWEMKNKIAKQAWEDDQELRGLASAYQPTTETVTMPNTSEIGNFNTVSTATQNGADFLNSAVEDRRRQDMAQSNLEQAPDTSGADYDEQGRPQAGYTPKGLAGAVQAGPLPAPTDTGGLPKVAGAEGYTPAPRQEVKMPPLGNVIAQPPPETVQTTRQAPANLAGLGQAQAQFLASKGRWKEAIAAAQGPLDITLAAPKHAQEMTKQFLSRVAQALAGGATPEQAKQVALQEMQRLGAPPEALQGFSKINVQPNGVGIITNPDGSIIATILDDDGTYKSTYHPKPTDTTLDDKAYGNYRETTFGGEKVQEVPEFHRSSMFTAEQNKQRWIAAGSKWEKLGDYNGIPKKVNENTVKVVGTGGSGRMFQALDTYNGNAPTFISREEYEKAPKGQYIPAGPGEKALNKQNLMSDISDNISDVKEALKSMPPFTATQAAQFSVALNDKNPSSAVRAFITSKIGQALDTRQQTYLIKLAQLHENALAMRPILGAGQGSQDLREAIRATLPNAASPTNEYAMAQLLAFEKTMTRLQRGVPNVQLNPMGGTKEPPQAAVDDLLSGKGSDKDFDAIFGKGSAYKARQSRKKR